MVSSFKSNTRCKDNRIWHMACCPAVPVWGKGCVAVRGLPLGVSRPLSPCLRQGLTTSESDYLSHELLGILLALPLISPQRTLGLRKLAPLALAVLWILGTHTQNIRLAQPVSYLLGPLPAILMQV